MDFEQFSGITIPLISFLSGYLLFKFQTNEQIKLSIYERRLNCYEKIIKFLRKVEFLKDEINTKKNLKSEIQNNLVKESFDLSLIVRPYVQHEVYRLLDDHISNELQELPESLTQMEISMQKIHDLIEKDIGKYHKNTITYWGEKFGKNWRNFNYFNKEDNFK